MEEGTMRLVKLSIDIDYIDLEMQKNEPKIFDLTMIAVYLAKLDEGLIVTRVGKTTKKGTKVTYKACESEEQANEYLNIVNKMIDMVKEKYNIGDPYGKN